MNKLHHNRSHGLHGNATAPSVPTPERGNDPNLGDADLTETNLLTLDLVILEWGLPPTFPAFMVPEEVGEFACEFTGRLLFFAFAYADELGWLPLLQALPHIAPNCVGFGLTVGGLGVPLMVKVGHPDA